MVVVAQERAQSTNLLSAHAEQAWASQQEGRPVVNAAKQFVGMVHAHAFQFGIRPPEATMCELSPEAGIAALGLVRKALEVNSGLKANRQLPDATAKRLQRIADYAVMTPRDTIVEGHEGDMSLKEVARTVATEHDDLRAIEALSHARSAMAETSSI